MSLPHALLVALIERPSSGSDLARRFDRSIGYFWPATHQQIYRELGRLEAAGWVQAQPPESSRGRKRAYRVLADGRAELRRWLRERGELKPPREELLVRLRAEAAIGPTPGLLQEIERVRAHHAEKLAIFHAIEARDFELDEPSRQVELQHLVLRSGIVFASTQIALCDRAIEVLGRHR